jgi:prepilin-type N-terminal cleavage/methylation domain-containing protein
MRNSPRNNTARAGFSLVEMLFAIAISALIAGAVVVLLSSQIQLSTTQNRNMLNQAAVRDVIKFMVDESQLAATANGSEPIIEADSTSYSFYADIDANGIYDQIDYYLTENNTLMRRYTTTISGSQFIAEDPLMNNVYNLQFTYYGANDAAPANNAEVTSVEITLQLDTTADETSFTQGRLAPQAMVGRATLRNKALGTSGP